MLDLAVCLSIAIASSTGVRYGYAWLISDRTTVPPLTQMGIWSIIMVLVFQNTLLLVYIRYRAGQRFQRLSMGTTTGFSRTTLVYCVLAVPLVLGLNMIVGLVFVLLGMQHNQAAQFPLIAGDTLGQTVFFLVAAVFVPVVEELLFRGYVFGKVSQGASPIVAIVVSALIFAGAHSWSASVGSIVLVVQTGVLGLCLGWVRYRSESMFPSMIAHGCNNAIALLLVLSCVNHPELGCAQT